MHCKTEEEAKNFCDYLHSIGRTWHDGYTYKSTICYAMHGEETAYNFNEGYYCNVQHYANDGYTILEWEDFMNNTFTKADLKTGDVILRRNGDVEIFNGNLGMFICQDCCWNDIDCLRDDLSSSVYRDYDIVAIRRPIIKSDCAFDAFEDKHGNLIYERKKAEEMTLAEVCKLLGKEIKIIP
jgi:hypothetical protein